MSLTTAPPESEITSWLAARLDLPAPRFLACVAEPPGRRPDRIVANDKIKSLLGWQPVCPTFREGYEKILSLS